MHGLEVSKRVARCLTPLAVERLALSVSARRIGCVVCGADLWECSRSTSVIAYLDPWSQAASVVVAHSGCAPSSVHEQVVVPTLAAPTRYEWNVFLRRHCVPVVLSWEPAVQINGLYHYKGEVGCDPVGAQLRDLGFRPVDGPFGSLTGTASGQLNVEQAAEDLLVVRDGKVWFEFHDVASTRAGAVWLRELRRYGRCLALYGPGLGGERARPTTINAAMASGLVIGAMVYVTPRSRRSSLDDPCWSGARRVRARTCVHARTR